MSAALSREPAELQALLGTPPGAARPQRAASALATAAERALERRPGDPQALVWRAEARLMSQRPADALRDVEDALAGAYDGAQARWLRAVCLSRLGRTRDAETAARRAVALAPEKPGGYALLGLLELQQGRPKEGLAFLEAAVRRARRRGWALGLRALALESLGRLAEARRDLGQALSDGPYPWMLARRAQLHNRLGFYWDGLADLKRLERALPGSPEPLMQAARIHLEQAQYRQALEKMGRAIRLSPADGRLLVERARLLATQHRLAEAVADIERAAALLPADDAVRFERQRLRVLAGAAFRCRGPREAGGRARWDFLKGLAAMKSGRFADAARAFGSVARAAGADEALRGRASFYRQAALVLRSGPAPARRQGPLSMALCGLGFRHPYQVSAETVRTLHAARLIYSNLSDERVSEFLSLFPAQVRPIVFRRADPEALVCARAVAKGLRGKGTVALATRGNPLFYGKLAERLVDLARRRRVPLRVPGSVSLAELFLAAGGEEAASAGLLVLDARQLGRGAPRPRTDVPLVVYNLGDAPARLGLLRRLKSLYPAGHPCHLLAGAGQDEYAPVRASVGGLRAALLAADPAVTLLLPPRSRP